MSSQNTRELLIRYTRLLEVCGVLLFKNGLMDRGTFNQEEVELMEIQSLALLIEENRRLHREISRFRLLAFCASCGTIAVTFGDLARFVAGFF